MILLNVGEYFNGQEYSPQGDICNLPSAEGAIMTPRLKLIHEEVML